MEGRQQEIIVIPSRSLTAVRDGPQSSRSPAVHRCLSSMRSPVSSPPYRSLSSSCTRTTGGSSSTMNCGGSVMPMGFASPPSPFVQGEGCCPFPSLAQERQLLREEQELDPGTQVPGIPTVRYEESAHRPSAAGNHPCSACQHPPAFHGPPGEGANWQQDPEEVPCSHDSAPPTSASSRGQ